MWDCFFIFGIKNVDLIKNRKQRNVISQEKLEFFVFANERFYEGLSSQCTAKSVKTPRLLTFTANLCFYIHRKHFVQANLVGLYIPDFRLLKWLLEKMFKSCHAEENRHICICFASLFKLILKN